MLIILFSLKKIEKKKKNNKAPKLTVNDVVRITKHKNTFNKGYT